MDFYQRKVIATKMIDDAYDKGVEKELIEFEIEKKFGFSEKFVEKRLKKLEKIELMAIKNVEKTKEKREVLEENGQVLEENGQVLEENDENIDDEINKILDAKPIKK